MTLATRLHYFSSSARGGLMLFVLLLLATLTLVFVPWGKGFATSSFVVDHEGP